MVACAVPASRELSTEARPACASNEHDFLQFYHAHFDAVMRWVLRFGIDCHDAEDLTQRVFMVAYRTETGALECPEAWLRAVTMRMIQEHFRWWRVRRAATWLVGLSWAGRFEDDRNPERNALADESLRQVRYVLRQMSAKLRDALVLLDIEGLTPREAAEVLGLPLNTLRSRRALARQEFKRLWSRIQPRKDCRDD